MVSLTVRRCCLGLTDGPMSDILAHTSCSTSVENKAAVPVAALDSRAWWERVAVDQRKQARRPEKARSVVGRRIHPHLYFSTMHLYLKRVGALVLVVIS